MSKRKNTITMKDLFRKKGKINENYFKNTDFKVGQQYKFTDFKIGPSNFTYQSLVSNF